MRLGGLHHVTAVTTRAAENVRFYAEVLGLRLVKKTVNQDDVSAYHLFYGDELGRPGTEVTFFDWPHLGATPNRAGAGEVSATALRVPDLGALRWWEARFGELGVEHAEVVDRDGRAFLDFSDPEGQRLRLVANGDGALGEPWDGGPVPAEAGTRGLGGVDLTVRDAGPTAWVLGEVLGFERVAGYEEDGARVEVYGVGGDEVRLVTDPGAPAARLGRGGVHHVAFRAADDEEHEAWRERIRAAGLGVTPQIDRYYFRSVYFREPGGVLFEIATDGPGFATDEKAEHLGEKLSLPPFLEPHREEIEARLTPLPAVGTGSGDRRAG